MFLVLFGKFRWTEWFAVFQNYMVFSNLRKALAKEKIFVPTNWSNVIRDCAPESYEYQWAADILPLPCDQRYGNEEMQRIADVIHALEP